MLGFGVLVVAYANLTSLCAPCPAPGGVVAELGPLGALAGALVWALWIERLRLADLGFTTRSLGRAILGGIAAGAAMALPSLVFFAFPVISPEPVHYAPYASLQPPTLLPLLFFRLPLRTVLVEETIFRGLIQSQGVRWLGLGRGIAVTTSFFVLWHAVITYQTVHETNLGVSPIPLPLLWAASALPLGAAGVGFSLLRQWTGSLAAPMVAHWLVNSSMLVFLYFQPFFRG